jgi:glycosyl transferase family 25
VTCTAVTVISLVDTGERRARFAEAANRTAVPWSFFEARLGISAPLHYDDRRARRAHGRTLTSGELGAYASHFAVWQSLLESGLQQMIVLEDDVAVDWPFIARLAALDLPAMGLSYARLFAKIPFRFHKLRHSIVDRYHHLIRITSYALGTQAYVITRDGAEQFMRHAMSVECPVDAYMDKYWRHGVPDVAVYPFPVFERSGSSSIGEARFEAQQLPLSDRAALVARRLQDRFAMVRHTLGLRGRALERGLARGRSKEVELAGEVEDHGREAADRRRYHIQPGEQPEAK